MTMLKALHPSDNIQYMSQEEKETEESPALNIGRMHKKKLEDYIKKKFKERLITAANNGTYNIRTNKTTTKHLKQKWEEKQLLKYFKWQILHQMDLDMATEAKFQGGKWIFSNSSKPPPKKNPVRTNYIEAKFDKTQQNSKFR